MDSAETTIISLSFIFKSNNRRKYIYIYLDMRYKEFDLESGNIVISIGKKINERGLLASKSHTKKLYKALA